MDYQKLEFDYARSKDQDSAVPPRHPVVVVGAGPVGLALAIDLAQHEVPVVLLDNDHKLSTGSRAICFAKRTLEIFDRLGVGDRMVDKGVSWSVGKVFFRNDQVYGFNLQPEQGYERPAFINLQQYYVEGFLADRAAELPMIDLRWKNKVVGVEQGADHVLLSIETPDGNYPLEARYVAACDGSRSSMRQLIGQESKGRVFRDRFLIADVKMKAQSPAPGRPKPGDSPLGGQRGEAASVGAHMYPAERWFWFDPPFNPGQSALLHMQPDGVWRMDFQLGWEADPEEETKPERIVPRVRALLSTSSMRDAEFELEWASVYTFACLRMERFRHGRVIFAGDSCHGVSPFGARGANSGVQDAENLAWKLALVLQGAAGDALLDTYGLEREYAADENIRNSTRATDFITPKSEISRLYRDAVLDLAKDHPFARTLINSGRLSVPATLVESTLSTPDVDGFAGPMRPGAPAADVPVCIAGEDAWLLRQLGGGVFCAVVLADAAVERRVQALREGAGDLPLKVLIVTRPTDTIHHVSGATTIVDRQGLFAKRYDALPGTTYLLRPDQHVCARWRDASAGQVANALRRALALEPVEGTALASHL